MLILLRLLIISSDRRGLRKRFRRGPEPFESLQVPLHCIQESFLRRLKSVEQILLAGLIDAASFIAHRVIKIKGNPEIPSQKNHYRKQANFEKEFHRRPKPKSRNPTGNFGGYCCACFRCGGRRRRPRAASRPR